MVIIELNKEQFFVDTDSVIYADKLDLEIRKEIIIKKILFYNGRFGKPYLNDVSVTAIVEKQASARKITIQKYRPKKNYKKKMGFRRQYTRLKIIKINAVGEEQQQLEVKEVMTSNKIEKHQEKKAITKQDTEKVSKIFTKQ